MATIGSLLQMLVNSKKCEFLVDYLLVSAYDVPDSKMFCVLVGTDSPWYQETFTYILDSTITPHLTKTQQQTFIHCFARYTILYDTLFQRHFIRTLLKCLDKEEVERALHEVHRGICGAHLSDLTLAKSSCTLNTTGPRWKKMSIIMWRNVSLVKSIVTRFMYLLRIYNHLLHLGLGKIHPTSSNDHKFIITTTKYLTK